MKRIGFILMMIGLVLLLTGISVYFIEKQVYDNYDSFDIDEVVRDENIDVDVNIGDNVVIDSDIAALEYMNCINSSLNIEELPENLETIINKLNDYFDVSPLRFAFKYKDLYTGLEISYNEKQSIYASSMIKAPTDIYIYELASNNQTNLDEEFSYEKKYQIGGTGLIKNSKYGTKYTIRDLVKYSIINSDNVAHLMLMDVYKRSSMLEFWRNKGTTTIFSSDSNWGNINAYDASLYMEELFGFYQNDDVYGKELMQNFLQTKFNLIKNDRFKIAHKYGWTGKYIHDAAIIFAENPYILVVLSMTGESNYQTFFSDVSELIDEFHTEYWKHKVSVCGNISQY